MDAATQLKNQIAAAEEDIRQMLAERKASWNRWTAAITQRRREFEELQAKTQEPHQ